MAQWCILLDLIGIIIAKGICDLLRPSLQNDITPRSRWLGNTDIVNVSQLWYLHNLNENKVPGCNISYNLVLGTNEPSGRNKQNMTQLPSVLQFWDIINKEFIHQLHHLIRNLNPKAIKIVWAHSHVAGQTPCHWQTTRIIHCWCKIYVSFCIVVHVRPSASALSVPLLRQKIPLHLILIHASFSILSRSIACGNLLNFNVSYNNAF